MEDPPAGPTAGRRTTIVQPPPGVSSTSNSPPTASTNPRATARPSPTPIRLSESPRRWNGWKTTSRSSGRIPGPRSMTRMSTLPATDPASMRSPVPAAWTSALSIRLATARSRSTGSVRTRGSVGLDIHGHVPTAWPEARHGGGDQLVHVGALVEDVHRTGLQAAHVEQVLDQAVQSVGFVIDGLEQDVGLVGPEGELVREEARRRRFDRRQRGAQVMAHRGQQGRPQLIGPCQRVGLGRLGMESGALQDRRQLGGEGRQNLPVFCGQARTPEGQNLPIGEGEHHRRLVRKARWMEAGRGHR